MIKRPRLAETVNTALQRARSAALIGPRQCGKTTLARLLAREAKATYFDLEDPVDQQRLTHPRLALEKLRGLVVIDEIQRQPELFTLLRVLLDRRPLPAKFLLLGSASPDLVKGISESLAGRVEFIDMHGFNLAEIGTRNWRELWVRGGYPLAYLAGSDADSLAWRQSFVRTFFERDLRALGIDLPPPALIRFFMMVAHYHGQLWNTSELASALQISRATVDRYLDVLSGAFMVRRLPPWFENLKKRQVKSPKVYVRDTGILHAQMRIEDFQGLLGHPKLGASWEAFAVEQILSLCGERDAYFWRTHAGAELDLFFPFARRRIGFEFKVSDAPSTTKSMHIAIRDLQLTHLYVVYPGANSYSMDDKITALGLADSTSVIEAVG